MSKTHEYFESLVAASVRADKVKTTLDRLGVLKEVIDSHPNEPIIYEFSYLDSQEMYGQPIYHISIGRLIGNELRRLNQKAIDLPVDGLGYSTLANEQFVQGYTDNFPPLSLETLQTIHINGDKNESIGFYIGKKAVGEYVASIHIEQSMHIEQFI